MDTTKLVVGQEVSIACGDCVYKVEVVEVTPKGGVIVRTSSGGLLRFDSNGKGWYIEETLDCPGPWFLEDEAKASLVVGQEVFVVSGCYYSNGKVVKVTQEGVEVQLARNPLPGPDNVVWQFDTKGKALDGVGTAEYGPYLLDDMSFEERKAELVAAFRNRTHYGDGPFWNQ